MHLMITSQEKIAAALSYLCFWMPVLMKAKTEFTIFHMKQGLIFHFIVVVASLCGYIWWIG
jgi:uncharacterized membrane protein